MSRFIPMAGPVRDVFEILEEEIDFECSHEDCAGQDVCELTTLTGLEQDRCQDRKRGPTVTRSGLCVDHHDVAGPMDWALGVDVAWLPLVATPRPAADTGHVLPRALHLVGPIDEQGPVTTAVTRPSTVDQLRIGVRPSSTGHHGQIVRPRLLVRQRSDQRRKYRVWVTARYPEWSHVDCGTGGAHVGELGQIHGLYSHRPRSQGWGVSAGTTAGVSVITVIITVHQFRISLIQMAERTSVDQAKRGNELLADIAPNVLLTSRGCAA